MSKQLSELQKEIYAWAQSKGWWEEGDRNHGQLMLLMVSELTEAHEELRHGHNVKEIYYNESKPEGVPIELADCVIRILDYCAHYDINLEAAINIKMEYNKTRPYRHGNKTA